MVKIIIQVLAQLANDNWNSIDDRIFDSTSCVGTLQVAIDNDVILLMGDIS